MMKEKLTSKEMAALKEYWKMPIRQKGNMVEAKKRNCWGVLYYTIEEAKKNAQIIYQK